MLLFLQFLLPLLIRSLLFVPAYFYKLHNTYAYARHEVA